MLNKLSNETNLQYIKRIVEGKLVDKTIDDDLKYTLDKVLGSANY